MRKRFDVAALPFVFALASCSSSNSTPSTPIQAPLPPVVNNGSVPASVVPAGGYSVSVFATLSGASSKPDSLVEGGGKIFVGTGDTVGPDGTPSAAGVAQTEVLQYDLSGTLQKTYEVPGHNDGLMLFDTSTLWAMSNEDSNVKLVTINIASGAEQVYTPQASLVNATGGLPHGGGLDDMVDLGGTVYVSGSNPTASTTAACPSNSSTPGCPNGVSAGAFAYKISLNGDGSTFNLVPVASSSTVATNLMTNAPGMLNVTDPDSETLSPDGSTLIVDGQGDSELTFVKMGATPSVSFLPLSGGEQVDDTRFAPSTPTFALLADTPSNTIYRIDGPFMPGSAYSSGATAFDSTNVSSGAIAPLVSGFKAPHGLLFYTP